MPSKHAGLDLLHIPLIDTTRILIRSKTICVNTKIVSSEQSLTDKYSLKHLQITGEPPINMMRFKSNVEELKKHIETHGHMNVHVKENRALNTWMSRIRTSYKQIEEGRPPHLNLTLDHIEILRQIGFDFESRTLLFEDRVEALRRYQAKHGHMNPTKREDKALFIFISNVKQTVKMMKEGHPKPLLKLPPHRMKMLEQIGFDFFKRKVVPFEVRIEALKDYKAKLS